VTFKESLPHFRSSLKAWFQLLALIADKTHIMHIASRYRDDSIPPTSTTPQPNP
jgi:hypothetical protein